MGYLIVFTKWPSDATPEVLKKAIEVTKQFPPDDSFGDVLVPNAVSADLNGYKTIGITQFKEGQLEALQNRTMRMLAMYGPVPGFEYKIELWATVEQAYAAIAQIPP
ncbi:MAG: hypothetical protein ACW990_16165 [Promethearchaeota archaeon]|jgi:hypothetical protein